MIQKNSSTCRISFLNKWTPDSHFWGIDTASLSLQMKRELFSCCDASGVLVNSDNYSEARLCGLSRRWNLLCEVNSMFSTFYLGDSFIIKAEKSANEYRLFIESFEKLLKSYLDGILKAEKGRLISGQWTIPKIAGQVHWVWVLACVLGWHFNVLPLVMDATHSRIPLSLWDHLIKRHSTNRRILLIFNIAELWHPNRLETLEAVIGFASERSIPVWLIERQGAVLDGNNVDANPSEGARIGESRFKSKITKRLSDARQKNIVDYLSPHGRSRLSEICIMPILKSNKLVIPDQV